MNRIKAKAVFCVLLALGGMLMACGSTAAPTPGNKLPIEHERENVQSQTLELSPFFEGYQGCFVLLDVAKDEYVRYIPERCAQRLSPCSTFKIPNSLIGLETGVISDQNHTISWDGTRYPVESWNRDHTLASALQNSVVWYYEALAAQVGTERMQQYLGDLHYGNEDASGGSTFWLGSSLAISADEQIDFLRRLHGNALPFSSRSTDIVKEILILEETDAYVYRGKTGMCMMERERQLGWFVGYVTRGDAAYIFATNIESPQASGREAQRIAEDILRHLNLLD
jgi:beta-lactamase class D